MWHILLCSGVVLDVVIIVLSSLPICDQSWTQNYYYFFKLKFKDKNVCFKFNINNHKIVEWNYVPCCVKEGIVWCRIEVRLEKMAWKFWKTFIFVIFSPYLEIVKKNFAGIDFLQLANLYMHPQIKVAFIKIEGLFL